MDLSIAANKQKMNMWKFVIPKRQVSYDLIQDIMQQKVLDSVVFHNTKALAVVFIIIE